MTTNDVNKTNDVNTTNDSDKTNDSSEPDDGVEQTCSACRKPFVPDEDGQTVCVECQEWRRALVIVGLFLLFFCFVLLPLLIQLLNTPKP